MIIMNNILLRSLGLRTMWVGSVLLVLSYWRFSLPHLNLHRAGQEQLLWLFYYSAVLEHVGLMITLSRWYNLNAARTALGARLLLLVRVVKFVDIKAVSS
jgi:hypothetical protein